ncbi:MAG TPA: RraA family protein [Oligoflexus sp.]|uniref:RraA family protein n=1 Tax=Oligoflexus sp. TaxID=1971216 RepID=UPI002D7E32DC|nr:RraA family protein [Oligoflexus sp.]HET9238510.1 RraA family protein [Oligoflexus sp.]
MADASSFVQLSPTTLAEFLDTDHVMDIGIRPLWHHMPRIAGPAYPVRCMAGDHLMLHAAIYRAPPGSVIVVEAGDLDYAVAGGNVCAVAKKHGITGFVVDGVLRDIAETRAQEFPVFGRGIRPIPGGKNSIEGLNVRVRCGGVEVAPGDMVVADEEGVVVIPADRCDEILQKAVAKAAKDAAESLDDWEKNHRARIEDILRRKGFFGPEDGAGQWV